MRLLNKRTGDTLELPPPDILGVAVIRFNGRVVERVFYSDVHHCVILSDGRRFSEGLQFAQYLISQLECGAYRAEAQA